MADSTFYEAFYRRAKEAIPDFLFEQVKSQALPLSGANARWKSSVPSIFEKIALPALRPENLGKLKNAELRTALKRINKLYSSARRKKEDTDIFRKAAAWVVKEMRDRKIGVDAKFAVLQDFIGKSDEEIAEELKEEVTKNYAETDRAGAPLNPRGFNSAETLALVAEHGRWEQNDAGYVPRAKDPYMTCGACRFYVRDEEGSSTGTCQVIKGPINWFGTSDLHICAKAEAVYAFAQQENMVHEVMMDRAFGVKKSYGDIGSDDDNNTDPKKPKMTAITVKEMIQKRIKQEGSEWVVTSDDGKKELGRHASRAAAVRQLAAVEASKKKTEKAQPTAAQVHTPGGKSTKKRKDPMGALTHDTNDVTNYEESAGVKKAGETKSEGGRNFKSSDYAYVPDASKPSTWKLRLTNTPGATPDPGIVGAAVAALGKGFRGQKVQIPSADIGKVKAKVRAAWKKANPDKDPKEMPEVIRKEERAEVEFQVPIAKIDDEKRKVYGIVLEPDEIDTQGDTITMEEIEKAAEGFMQKARRIGLRHRKLAKGVTLTDSYVTQGDTVLGKTKLKKGTWIIGVKIENDAIWSGVKSGEYNGFSVGGMGNRKKNA